MVSECQLPAVVCAERTVASTRNVVSPIHQPRADAPVRPAPPATAHCAQLLLLSVWAVSVQ